MTDWSFSVVVIVPSDLQDKANRLSCALGYDELPGNTFSVALSADGKEPATHYGCRTVAKQEFIDIMTSASNGTLPDIQWADYGVSPADIAEVIGAQIFDARPVADAMGHFDDALLRNSLMRVEPIVEMSGSNSIFRVD